MINKKHCDLIYCNSLKQSKAKQSKAKQSKANAKLYLLTNNYFKFLFQIQKYFLDLFAIFNNNVDCHAFIKARPLCAPHGDDDLNKFCNDRKKSVITRAKPEAKARRWRVIHFLTSINSDNLSGINSRFVINNFNLIKEDIHMRISKKILTIILSVGLLFLISCGDRPTGSDSGGGTIPSDYRNRYYKNTKSISDSGGQSFWWLYINNDGNIQYAQSANKPTTSTEFTDTFKGSFSGNTFTFNEDGASIKFEFKSDFSSVTVSGAPNEDLNGTYNQVE